MNIPVNKPPIITPIKAHTAGETIVESHKCLILLILGFSYFLSVYRMHLKMADPYPPPPETVTANLYSPPTLVIKAPFVP